jgi:hypothetical protein
MILIFSFSLSSIIKKDSSVLSTTHSSRHIWVVLQRLLQKRGVELMRDILYLRYLKYCKYLVKNIDFPLILYYVYLILDNQ